MTKWVFESRMSHFIGILKKTTGIDNTNMHLLILDGHNSHVNLEVVAVAMNSGLGIISLPSHTSHALQSLNVSCFKSFKTAFRQIKDCSTFNIQEQEGRKNWPLWMDIWEILDCKVHQVRVSKNRDLATKLASSHCKNPRVGFEEGQEGCEFANGENSNEGDSSAACEEWEGRGSGELKNEWGGARLGVQIRSLAACRGESSSDYSCVAKAGAGCSQLSAAKQLPLRRAGITTADEDKGVGDGD